ncbi:YHYH domain-containing protein [Rhizobacter fulvus]
MKKVISASIGALLMSLAGFAIGHSGGTDSAGCHTETATGLYHCHKPK